MELNKNCCQCKNEPVGTSIKPPAKVPWQGSCPSSNCPVAQFLSALCPSCKEAQEQEQKLSLDLGKKPVIWVLGGPGSGKGTQCSLITAKYGFVHISTGNLLRDEMNKMNSERGKHIAKIMEKGGLVPNSIVLELVKEAIKADSDKANGFLIDGFPREMSQAIEFEKTIGPVTMMKFFDASDETLIERLLHRGKTSGRADDNEETIKHRLKTFNDHNHLVLAQYPHKVRRINAEKAAHEVFAEVETHLDPLMAELADSP